MNFKIIGAIALIAVGAANAAYATDLKLTDEQRQHLGIQSVAIAATATPQRFEAGAQVLDSSVTVTLLGDWRSAQIAADASRVELQRAEKLHAADANLSLKAVEAARVQAANDSARARTLHAQVQTTLGRAIAVLNDSDVDKLVHELLDAQCVLVRAELTGNTQASLSIDTAQLRALDDDESWPAIVLGRIGNATSSIGNTYLLRVSVPKNLQAGQALIAELSNEKQMAHGFAIPSNAVLRWQGQQWIYVEESHDRFERRAIHPLYRIGDAYLVTDGVQAGEQVVTVGAGMLLALEFNQPAED